MDQPKPRDVSQERLQVVLDSVPALIAYYDASSVCCVFSNQAYARSNGKTVDWVIGRHCREIIGEPAWQLIEPQVNRVLHGETVNYERSLTLPDGNTRQIEVNLLPHLLSEGPQAGVFVLINDITHHHDAERAVRESEERLNKFSAATTEGIVFHDRGVIQDVNSALAQMVGYAPDAIIGKHVLDYIAPELRSTTQSYIASSREEPYESNLIRSDGSLLPVEITGKSMVLDGKRMRIAVVHDLTERNELQSSLRKALAERETILETTAVGVTFLKNRVHQWVNGTMTRLLGYSHAELLGQPTRMHYASDEEFERIGARAYQAIAATGTFSGETRMRRKSGEIIWVKMDGAALDRTRQDEGTVWAYLDISAAKAAEEEAAETINRQRELADLKSRFVAMASHELRTPLAAILSCTDILRHYGEKFTQQERNETLNDITVSVKRMQGLLENVLLIGKSDAGRLDFAPQPTDIRQLLLKIVAEVQVASAAHVNLRFDSNAVETNHTAFLLDENLVRHIVINLLTNACKYTPDGGHVSLGLQRLSNGLGIHVRDTGIGIPAEDLPQLFESFHRASNVGNIPGTGLGLSIVKRSVDLHGGTIAVASELGVGTAFTVCIPAAIATAATQQEAANVA